MHSIGEAWDCARPFFLDTGDKQFPLRRTGSCFLVSYRGDLWIVTAKHCLDGEEPHLARVLRTLEYRRPVFLHIVSQLHPIDRDRDDTAWLDMMLIRSDELPGDTLVIDLDTTPLAPLEDATTDDYVRIAGFPDALGNEIVDNNIAVASFSGDGHYAGATESKWVHKIAFEDFGKLGDINGMSGGPAFLAREGEQWWFAGVVAWGTAQSGIVRFIDARAIVKTLAWHYDEDPGSSVAASKRRPRPLIAPFLGRGGSS